MPVVDARHIEQHVQTSVLLHDNRNSTLDGVAVGDVANFIVQARSFESLFAAGAHHDLCARLVERQGDGSPDAA